MEGVHGEPPGLLHVFCIMSAGYLYLDVCENEKTVVSTKKKRYVKKTWFVRLTCSLTVWAKSMDLGSIPISDTSVNLYMIIRKGCEKNWIMVILMLIIRLICNSNIIFEWFRMIIISQFPCYVISKLLNDFLNLDTDYRVLK